MSFGSGKTYRLVATSLIDGYKFAAEDAAKLVHVKNQEITQLNNKIASMSQTIGKLRDEVERLKTKPASEYTDRLVEHMNFQDERIIKQRKQIKELLENVEELKADLAKFSNPPTVNKFMSGQMLKTDKTSCIPLTDQVREVYGTLVLKAGDGYEFTGEFRAPKCDEYYLNLASVKACKAFGYHNEHEKRLILRKVETKAAKPSVMEANHDAIVKVYGSVPTIPFGYEVVDFRPLQAGDNYLMVYWDAGGIGHVKLDYPLHERLILRKLESKVGYSPDWKEVESVYGYRPAVDSRYEVVDFRVPRVGDEYVTKYDKVVKSPSNYDEHNTDYRRLIVVKKAGVR